MTGVQAQSTGARLLAAAGVANPRTDARILLAFAAGVSRDRLVLIGDQPLSADIVAAYSNALERRAARVPVSHITGAREFYGRRFIVTPDVLDPRPDTETLIEVALSRPYARVLDLGTGSGCIVLTLLAERPGAEGIGTDISARALEVAGTNGRALGVGERVELLVSDWFSDVRGRFDLIVSNPPYIAQAEMAELEPEVRDYEPHAALTPGGDGLDAYRAIAAGLGAHLVPGGRVLLEIGPTQAEAVSALLAEAGLGRIAVHHDLDGRDRVVEAFAND
ncbi:MAG: peptide chain release factor N(5)-glutamine methyltransferase [Paracoccaceae bacterium]